MQGHTYDLSSDEANSVASVQMIFAIMKLPVKSVGSWHDTEQWNTKSV